MNNTYKLNKLLILKLMEKLRKFEQVQKKYSKWGSNDSESSAALRDVVEGDDPNTVYWGLFDGYPKIAKEELVKTSKKIYKFLLKHKKDPSIHAFLLKTENLRHY